MSTAPGWYIDDKDASIERYHNGGSWTDQTRPTTAGAATLRQKARTASAQAEPSVSSWLSFGAGFAATLAVLGILGALIGGIALMTHKGQSCTVNPYDDTLQTCTATHPLLAAGLIALIAGLLQAVGWLVVSRLCRIVADMQAAQSRA